MTKELKIVVATLGAVAAIALVWDTYSKLNQPDPNQQALDELNQRLEQIDS